jgi:hypothetical protein
MVGGVVFFVPESCATHETPAAVDAFQLNRQIEFSSLHIQWLLA